jgi:S-adenosylmethionine hydrolase
MRNLLFCLAVIFLFACSERKMAERKILVFQSDFGLKDGAVAAMKGVSCTVSNNLQIYDLTHEIQPFNISEAAYRLHQSASYWPSGTVFVSIVDPGVGSTRKSIVMKTKTGHYFVTPDNGTLTLIAESMGIEGVREIDETKNRLQGSAESYTFHGRDVYAYTGARLASETITFEEVGKELEGEIVRLPGLKPTVEGEEVTGSIPVLDIQYGNVWTNIDRESLEKIGVKGGDSITLVIYFKDEKKFERNLLLGHTFSDVRIGSEIAYMNSLLNLSFGVRQGSFAERHEVSSGEGWVVRVRRAR